MDISEIYLLNITLPTRLELPNLQQLCASNCRLQGYLPTTWNTPSLESLILDLNDLIGRLPDDIGKCTGLKQLMLQNNRLTGNFPGSYGDLYQLVNLSLIQSQYGGLCGPMPDTWETMFSLENVSLCAFGFGPLPDYIGENWQQLQSLRITGGSYGSNDIPISLCKLAQLQHLQNRFTGTIPGCIFTLTYLDVSFNYLSGLLSEAIGSMSKVTHLSLANNYLNWTLPQSIGKLTSITYLSLHARKSIHWRNTF